MKIAFLGTHRPHLSGGMVMVLLLVDGLRRLGHQVRVVADQPPPEWAPVEVRWETAPAPATLLEGDEAVVTGMHGIRMALESGASVVGHLCVGYEPHLWPAAREQCEAIYRLPAVKLVIAPHLQRTLRSELGVDSVVIGAPVALRWFEGTRAGDPDGALRVLTVGPEPVGPLAPVPFKGIASVLEAVRAARSDGHELELVRMLPAEDPLIGAPGIDELHLGLEPRAVPKVMASCQIYISGSTAAEGLGMPAVEAATAGLAGVLPAIPSYRDVDGLDRAALFYPPGDARAAADALGRLLRDRGLRSELAAAGPELDLPKRFDPLLAAERLAAAVASAGRS